MLDNLIRVGLLATVVGALGAQDAPQFADLRYRNVGPSRGGRVTTVAGVAQRPGTYLMGATGGGVWKTENFGNSWRNVSDGTFATPSIGAIRYAPSDPEVVYCGTGSDGLRSNVIAGKGVYKSTDGGESWSFVGLEATAHIGAVEVHPFNPDVVFVAAIGNAFAPNPERGLYRSIDGGATWDKVLYVSERTGIVDVEFSPMDPNVLFASAWQAERKPWTIRSGGDEGGIWRSTDTGSTWTKLDGGLPKDPVGKIDLAVTPADPTRLYALVEAPGDQGGLWVSFDGGASFQHVSADDGIRNRPFYYTNVDVCPQDPKVVYVSATGFHRSADGGKTWSRVRTPHGDHHDLWIHPEHPDWWIQGNDGGATVTLDGGRSWSSIVNQPTAELYQVAVDHRYPYWLYAGQQDNSTIRVPAFRPHPSPAGEYGFWESVGGCETGPAVPDPRDPDIVYANCKGRFGVYNHRTGQEQRYDVGAAFMYGHDPKDLRYRFQRVSPIHVSPHDPGVVYHCSQFVHRTADRGRTWETISPDLTAFDPTTQGISGTPITRDITGEEFHSTIYAIRESTVAAGTIWVGANDGPVHVTRDGGGSWQLVTPPGVGPHGRVDCVEPSPHDADKAYVTILRYQLDDWRPHVYRTTDGGATWTWLTGPDSGVPQDAPARVLREDPERQGLLYLGTEWGLFVSFDDGAHWQPLQQNLPVTPITDLVVHRGDLVVATMGRSFWILEDLTPLRVDAASIADARLFLATPRAAVRQRGAVLDYVVGDVVEDAQLTLEIFDDAGQLVRRFGGDGDAAREADDVFVVDHHDARSLVATAGHHRFEWDCRHAGIEAPRGARGGFRAPRVRPGTYEVRLRLGDGTEVRRPLEVRLDPRVLAEGLSDADAREQEQFGLRLRELTLAARNLLLQVDRGLEAAAEGSDEQARLAALRTDLVIAEGAYMQPMLVDQISYLTSLSLGSDQLPGRDAVERAGELEARYADLRARFDDVADR